MSESIPLNGAGDEKSGGRITNMDIISTLPDCIVTRILSLLTTQDIVRTSVLSTYWEYKWTNIDVIDIDESELFTYTPIKRKTFCDFVKNIFSYSPVKSFRLKCSQNYNQCQMDLSLDDLLREFYGESIEVPSDCFDIYIPHSLMDSTSLKILKLELRCTIRIPVTKSFSNLTKLYLVKARIMVDFYRHLESRKLILNFPVLESLELEDCEWLCLDLVEIYASALKLFRSQCPLSRGKYQIKIFGATLLSFEAGGALLEDIVLSESSVGYAAIGSDTWLEMNERDNGLQARKLLKGFSGLKHLKIYAGIFQALSHTKQELPLPIFDGLKQLELDIKDNFGASLELLSAAPSLETLILDVGRLRNRGQYDSESVPPCVVSHVKEVKFTSFHGYTIEVHLADYLLKNALNLQKMLGLVRKKAEKNPDGISFWAILKSKFENCDFEVGKDIKSMADFEKAFGEEES